MECYSLKVVSLKQNIYLYKKLKPKKTNKKMFFSLFIFVVSVSSLFGLKMLNVTEINQVINTATYLVNPINPLYSDMGDIVFTSGYNLVKLKNEKLNFVAPVVFSTYEINNNILEFNVTNNPILKCPENGVVSEIYFEGNTTKCVKIKHSKNTYSVIKNVDILGVHLGAIVKQNQTIGTVKLNSNVKFIIEVNGEAKNLSVDGLNVCIN